MSLESILVFLLFLLVPGASLYWGARQKKRADMAEAKFKEEVINEKLEEKKQEVLALSDDELLDLARKLYPNKSSGKLPENK